MRWGDGGKERGPLDIFQAILQQSGSFPDNCKTVGPPRMGGGGRVVFSYPFPVFLVSQL